jgi:hypothetical protein
MKAILKVKSFGIGYCIRFSFEHLHRDVRNIVYGFLALCPFNGAYEVKGLTLSYREAKNEADKETARAFRLSRKSKRSSTTV